MAEYIVLRQHRREITYTCDHQDMESIWEPRGLALGGHCSLLFCVSENKSIKEELKQRTDAVIIS